MLKLLQRASTFTLAVALVGSALAVSFVLPTSAQAQAQSAAGSAGIPRA